MSHSISVDSAGRIVLPAGVRRQLNLVAGSRLVLDVVAQRIELVPETPQDPALTLTAERRAVLPASGRAFDAAAATRDERQAQARRGKPG